MKVSICIAFLALGIPAFAQADVRIENPIRGWRASSDKTNVVQEVRYPASSVNMRGNHSANDIIRGDILSDPKSTSKSEIKASSSRRKSAEPLTLIVNGLDMPLRQEGSKFERPYIFAKGSNSVEVRDGKSKHAVQFFETNSTSTPARLRVLLSWDTDNTDLDLHLVTPDGEHCFYGNRRLASGAALDIDVTTGYGPEIISVPSPRNGTYLVYVNYYGGGRQKDLTTAKVSILSQAGTPDEKIESSLVPMRAPGDLMLVKSFHYP